MASKQSSRASKERVRYSKSNLPEKICPVCLRPFSWRKKWRDCWDEVKYCSRRCRGERQDARAPRTS